MKNIDNYIDQLRNNRDLSSLPVDYIKKLENELKVYTDKIKSYQSAEMAEDILIELGYFQEKLAELSFKYNVTLSEKLNMIVRYYDRPDDPDARKFFFKLAKEKL